MFSRLLSAWPVLFALLIWQPANAQPINLSGKWFQPTAEWIETQPDTTFLIPIEQTSLTGGHFLYRAKFEIAQGETMVLDFKNSSVIGTFHHRVFDKQDHLLAEMEGGIQSTSPNPYFLRHGRDLKLPPGEYRLDSEISSPFLLAQPEPYLDTQENYTQTIKAGNALTLLCLGLLLGLTFYYAALAVIRRNVTDIMYALFILGNLFYNGTALLVYPELFGMHWFYLISLPILFSNCAYVLFVMRLLNITRNNTPRLYQMGIALLAIFTAFILLALLKPNWSLELDRLGVGLFLCFSFAAGIARTKQGHPSARMYLFAITIFFSLGILSLILGGLEGIYTLYIEHLGLFSVTMEALLLALVLARQFEQLRQEKERAITDSLDKSRFLAAASHDLRQPMHALVLFVGELSNHVTSPQQSKLVKLIDESVHAMSGLLDSLLDVSKLDSGLVVPSIRPFPIEHLLGRMEQEYVPLAAKYGVELNIRYSDAQVESDAVLLERILLNLVSNAIRYTPEGGRILLACRKRGKYLRIEVRDNGIGIPLDKQQDIFLEFVQLGNAGRARDKGLGLGLSIVQRLCRLLHYPISLRSFPERGSVFSVEIPLSQLRYDDAPEKTIISSAPDASQESVEIENTRILFVEDDLLVQQGTLRLLESWGCKVQIANSLAQAQQQLAAAEFDLLISDYRLPDGNGLQLTPVAAQMKLKRILISGDSAPEILKDAQMQGWHLLHKPVKPAKLHSLVLFVLKGR